MTDSAVDDGEGFVYSLRNPAPGRSGVGNVERQASRPLFKHVHAEKHLLESSPPERMVVAAAAPCVLTEAVETDVHARELGSKLATGPAYHNYPAANTSGLFHFPDSESSVSPMARFLFHHYVSEAVRITAPSDYARFEICHFIVPMSRQWPCLYSAVAAFAAVHLHAIGGLPGNADNLIAAFQGESIQNLRRHLDEKSPLGQVAVLAATRTLCQAHIFRGEKSWRTYLDGARAVIQSTGCPQFMARPSTGDIPQNFLSSWYNNAEALAALTPLGLPRGQLESEYLKNSTPFFDPFGGVASDLPDLLREVGALCKERSRRGIVHRHNGGSILSYEDITLESDVLIQECRDRLERDGIRNLLSDRRLLLVLTGEEIGDYALSNAGFLHTALLHIYCGVKGLPLSSVEVQHSVEQVIRCARDMKPSTGSSPRVLLVTPLFTAGLCAVGPAREMVKAALADIGKWMRTPHIIRARTLLEEYWSKLADSNEEDMWSYLGTYNTHQVLGGGLTNSIQSERAPNLCHTRFSCAFPYQHLPGTTHEALSVLLAYLCSVPCHKLKRTPLILWPRCGKLVVHLHVSIHPLRRYRLKIQVDIPEKDFHLGHC